MKLDYSLALVVIEVSLTLWSGLSCGSGGESGAAGLNLLHRADGRVLNLGAKTTVTLQPGVRPHAGRRNPIHSPSVYTFAWRVCHIKGHPKPVGEL